MKVFVTIVSHGHEDFILNNKDLSVIAQHDRVEVLVKDNLASKRLGDELNKRGIYYLGNAAKLGFGANNNESFIYCRDHLGMTDLDYFVVINPDVFVTLNTLLELVDFCESNEHSFATIALFQDCCHEKPDLNVKQFPSLLDFAWGFLFGINPAAYDKDAILRSCVVDWASGAFLLFRADLYGKLGGFDERFFMYLEDVDICRRAFEEVGERLWYFPQFKAVHLCKQANKRFLSQHFWWFLFSMFRYFCKYRSWARLR